MTVTLEKKKPLEYYTGLNYPVTIEAAPEGGYFAKIENLPGCYAQGETIDEAFEMIEVAKRLWMESMYEDGMEIPEPDAPQVCSGKILVRTPKSLHKALDRMADREGVSLNQLLVATLSKAVGFDEGQAAKPKRKRRAAGAKT
jgi:predicted RNase H-like HicB family nuclease